MEGALDGQSSFMKMKTVAGSAAAVEALANSCSYARLATMGVYQGLNIATHVFGVVTKLVCACIDVGTQSQCLLRSAAPWPCESVFGVYESLLSSSSSVWAAVKSTTASCRSVG